MHIQPESRYLEEIVSMSIMRQVEYRYVIVTLEINV